MRRVLAICVHHRIDQERLVGNLFIDSGREIKLIIAEMVRRDFKIAIPVKNGLIAALKLNAIDILSIDPFVKTYRVSENDNAIMDAVAEAYADIADQANCSVELAQHTRKLNGAEVTIEDARGASAVSAATRAARTLNRMTMDDAEKASIPAKERRFYVRIDDDAKANLTRPDKARWIHLKDVGLGNFGADPALDREDRVQVVEPWDWPDALRDMSLALFDQVRSRLAEQPRRKDIRSKDWVGHVVIEEMKLNRDNKAHRHQASAILQQWLMNGALKTMDGVDEKGRPCEFVGTGQWPDDKQS
jgi:hypothetical protein